MSLRALALTAIVGAPAHADEPTWHTYAALRNDVFSELLPPMDDLGFTHDNVVSLVRRAGDITLGGGFLHRWITSTMDYRRWDQLEVVALGERAWPHRITTSARIGPTLGGNFGGRYLQNGWHEITGTGPTLAENGLANDYPDERRIGLLAGARARIQLGDATGGMFGWSHIDAQAGLGAGVSSIETAIGGSAGVKHVGAHVELAVTRYHASDPLLALPGGYGSGWQLEWRAGVHVAWSRFRVSYQYRANEGGSGEPIGVLAFQSVR